MSQIEKHLQNTLPYDVLYLPKKQLLRTGRCTAVLSLYAVLFQSSGGARSHAIFIMMPLSIF